MKKTIFLAALLFSFHLVNAQEATTNKVTPQTTEQTGTGKKDNHKVSPEQKADKFTSKMTEAIGLEESQKSKVRSFGLRPF